MAVLVVYHACAPKVRLSVYGCALSCSTKVRLSVPTVKRFKPGCLKFKPGWSF